MIAHGQPPGADLEIAGTAADPHNSREGVDAILRRRAEALARRPPEVQDSLEYLEILEFRLAYESYGLEIRTIREVAPLRAFTPVPSAPAFVVGIVNVHGRIVSVLDLKRFFELPGEALSDLNKVIVVGSDHMEFGILADAILQISRVPIKALQRSLPTLTGTRDKYLHGVTREQVVVLDAARLLADEALVVHEQVR